MGKYMPFGADLMKGGCRFRLFAPYVEHVDLLIEKKKIPMKKADEVFTAFVASCKAGTLYRFCLNGKQIIPDPWSRFQPAGPHGPSEVIDPNGFRWNEKGWKGIVHKERAILYELHVGTFTQEGTWRALIKKLAYLKKIGITIIEIMPIAAFPGAFNWGYDGVDLFAPTHNYGRPEDLKAFIQAAHRLNLGVILDVVYNHFGPDGNYLPLLSPFFKKELTEWGQAPDFGRKEVRTFYIENAAYWVREFHFDGFRFDACHSIQDTHQPHILKEVTRRAYKEGATFISAENDKQEAHYFKKTGLGMDAVWNEDFHHAAFVRLTRSKKGYVKDFTGSAQEFLSLAKYHFLYQGQWSSYHKKRRGTNALGAKPFHIINFLENHDQVANLGKIPPSDTYLVLFSLLLLMPQLPLIFQGQEFGSRRPFHYFCDHKGKLAKEVFEGRRQFAQSLIPSPHNKQTFLDSKLDWKKEGRVSMLFRSIIKLRKQDPVLCHLDQAKVDGAVLSDDVLLLRYISPHGERLLLFNLGDDFTFHPQSEPLFAPPQGQKWELLWSFNGKPMRNKLKKQSVALFYKMH